MVDLVKIRKKAKEKKEAEAAEAPPAAPVALERPRSSAGVAPQRPVPAAEPEPAGPTRSAGEDPSVSLRAGTPAPKVSPSPESSERPQVPPGPSKLQRFLETAGQQRGVQIKKETDGATDQVELLTFTIAGEQYAVAIDGVVIITPRPVTRIPNADPSIVGILSLRGTIIVILDARARLGHPPAGAPDLDTRIIVVDRNGESTGFFVDRVARVIKVPASDIQPHPVAHASEHDETIRGVFKHGEALTILLDLDKLLERGVAASVP